MVIGRLYYTGNDPREVLLLSEGWDYDGKAVLVEMWVCTTDDLFLLGVVGSLSYFSCLL